MSRFQEQGENQERNCDMGSPLMEEASLPTSFESSSEEVPLRSQEFAGAAVEEGEASSQRHAHGGDAALEQEKTPTVAVLAPLPPPTTTVTDEPSEAFSIEEPVSAGQQSTPDTNVTLVEEELLQTQPQRVAVDPDGTDGSIASNRPMLDPPGTTWYETTGDHYDEDMEEQPVSLPSSPFSQASLNDREKSSSHTSTKMDPAARYHLSLPRGRVAAQGTGSAIQTAHAIGSNSELMSSAMVRQQDYDPLRTHAKSTESGHAAVGTQRIIMPAKSSIVANTSYPPMDPLALAGQTRLTRQMRRQISAPGAYQISSSLRRPPEYGVGVGVGRSLDNIPAANSQDEEDVHPEMTEEAAATSSPRPPEESVEVSATVVDEQAERQRETELMELRQLVAQQSNTLPPAITVEAEPLTTVPTTELENGLTMSALLKTSSRPWFWVSACTFLALMLGVIVGVTVIKVGDRSSPNTPGTTVSCFYDAPELARAVDAFLQGSVDSSPAAQGPINSWCVSNVDDFGSLFSQTRNPLAANFNEDISSWDLSRATNMAFMFQGASSFNQDISTWNVSLVTSMQSLFDGAITFNQNLSLWDVANVENMQEMFYAASSFNGDLSALDVSRVVNMLATFQNASAFDSDISRWNVSLVTDFSYMFSNCSLFNQNLSAWNTGRANNTESMFANANSFNGDISAWDVSRVSFMSYMFYQASSFNQDLSAWDVSNVQSMQALFFGASSFNQQLSSWNLSNVYDTSLMFYGASSFDQDISPWDTGKVQDMSLMFVQCSSFNQNLDTWDVSSVTNMRSMFDTAGRFDGRVSRWRVSRVTDMSYMFVEADMFDQDISSWDVSRVEAMQGMFGGANSFNSPLNSWNVSKVTDFSFMFAQAAEFDQELFAWDVSNALTMRGIFENASSFNRPLSTWDVSRVTDMTGSFRRAQSFNQDLSTWNIESTLNYTEMFSMAIGFDQNLCAWGLLIPLESDVSRMFLTTSCAFQSDPILTSNVIGPFCSACN